MSKGYLYERCRKKCRQQPRAGFQLSGGGVGGERMTTPSLGIYAAGDETTLCAHVTDGR